MTPKGLVKRTAKDTGKAMVYGYTASSRGRMAYEEMMANGVNMAPGTSNMKTTNDDNENGGDKKGSAT